MLSSVFPEFYHLNPAVAFLTQQVAVTCLLVTVPITPNQSGRSRRRHRVWSLLRTASSMNEGPGLKVNTQSKSIALRGPVTFVLMMTQENGVSRCVESDSFPFGGGVGLHVAYDP